MMGKPPEVLSSGVSPRKTCSYLKGIVKENSHTLTMSYYRMPVRMVIIKKIEDDKSGKDTEKVEHLHIFLRNVNIVIMADIIMASTSSKNKKWSCHLIQQSYFGYLTK